MTTTDEIMARVELYLEAVRFDHLSGEGSQDYYEANLRTAIESLVAERDERNAALVALKGVSMMPPIPEPSPDLLYSADEMLDYGKACRAQALGYMVNKEWKES